MTMKQQIVQNLPGDISRLISQLPDREFEAVQEIRMRTNRPLLLCGRDGTRRLSHTVTQQDMEACLQIISGASIYAFLEEIANGYLTIEGGHRVGLCGRVVLHQGAIQNIKQISGINFRIARQIPGCANEIMPYINEETPCNVLILSPPQCGKTTMLRDIARQLGRRHNISIVDERGELTAMRNGVPQFDVGERTDVLDLCPKRLGIPLMLRSMSPDVILTDEIAQPDIPAMRQALSYGVRIIASAHGDDIPSTIHRLAMGDVIDQFGVILLLSRRNGVGTVETICKGSEII